jgi:hypothetical protein
MRGRIYLIVYRGGARGSENNITPCPDATAPAGKIVGTDANPSEGTNPDAGAPASVVAVPEGATAEMVTLGGRIYRGQVGGAACTGCHGDKGQGSTLGPDLTGKQWLWSDGMASRFPSFSNYQEYCLREVPLVQRVRNC